MNHELPQSEDFEYRQETLEDGRVVLIKDKPSMSLSIEADVPATKVKSLTAAQHKAEVAKLEHRRGK